MIDSGNVLRNREGQDFSNPLKRPDEIPVESDAFPAFQAFKPDVAEEVAGFIKKRPRPETAVSEYPLPAAEIDVELPVPAGNPAREQPVSPARRWWLPWAAAIFGGAILLSWSVYFSARSQGADAAPARAITSSPESVSTSDSVASPAETVASSNEPLSSTAAVAMGRIAEKDLMAEQTAEPGLADSPPNESSNAASGEHPVPIRTKPNHLSALRPASSPAAPPRNRSGRRESEGPSRRQPHRKTSPTLGRGKPLFQDVIIYYPGSARREPK